MSTRLGLIGVGLASVLWLTMAAFLTAFPTEHGAPTLTWNDMVLGTLVGSLLFGGVGAILGHIEDHPSKE
jgi:uncharacterized membrane protein YedE/YeeE